MMTSPFNMRLHPGWTIVAVMDLAIVIAVSILVSNGRPEVMGRLLTSGAALLVVPGGVIYVTVLAACGFYQTPIWFAALRMVVRAILAVFVLLQVTAVLVALSGLSPKDVPASYWYVPLLCVALAVALRLGLASVLHTGLARPQLSLIRSPSARRAKSDGIPTEVGVVLQELPMALNDAGRSGSGLANPGLRHGGMAAPIASDPDRGRGHGASPVDQQERQHRRVDLGTLPEDWLSSAAVMREGRMSAALRRGFDIAGSVALLILTLPLLLLTALAIRLEGPGPIFYRQERVGQHGRVFRLFKFRSMSVDAEKAGPRWAAPSDPRVTKVGRLIRLTRVDEIPQAINVLRGDMALIGPRPERPTFVDHLATVIPHYDTRSAVRPGITGWAQINYPYGASVEDARNKLAYDLYYLRHRSLGLDAAIILGTIRVIVLQEGSR